MEESARRSTDKRNERIYWALSCVGLLVVMAACATAPPPPELVQARAGYEVAAGNPAVAQNAPVDLFEARKSLDRAESAYAEEVDAEEIAHLSTLAIKRTQIAEAEARARAADKEAERLGKLRERGRYDVQARQAELATGEAERARVELESLTASRRDDSAESAKSAESAESAESAATAESASTAASIAALADAIARLEARLTLRDRELAAAAGEQQLRALETTRLAEQPRAAELRGDVEWRMSEIAASDNAAEQRSRELIAANEDAERQLRELQAANQAAERAVQTIETHNAALEQEALEILASMEAGERSMLEEQSGLEASARTVTALATTDLAEARRQAEDAAARAAAERRALETLESQESAEYRQRQALIAEETDALRTLDELAQRAGNVAAARAALERASSIDAEARRAQDLRDEASSRAQELADENQRLRASNEALLAAVSAAAPLAPAPPAPAPARQVDGAARDVVVVSEGRDGVSTIERSLVREEPAPSEKVVSGPQGELAIELAEERDRRLQAESLHEKSYAFAVEARETAEQATETAEQASKRAALLERERAELQEWRARLEPGKIVLTLGDLFASNGAEPRTEVHSSLQRLAALLKERPGRQIVIEGHTDGLGDRQYNMELSLRRAEAVRSFLENQGVPGPRMRAAGLGEDAPVAPNNTADGRGRNRRIEVSILDAPVAPDPVSG